MKSKKLLLGSLSAMALVATPIAAVVSCSKGDDKVLKSTAKGFVAGEGYYIPEALASKAGSFTLGDGDSAMTFTWDKALKVGEEITVKGNGKEEKVKAAAADADHFILPFKGKSGVGNYLTKDQLKQVFERQLNAISKTGARALNLDPKVDADKVTEIGINDINAFLKASGLEVKSATAKEVAKSGDTPKHFKFTLAWK